MVKRITVLTILLSMVLISGCGGSKKSSSKSPQLKIWNFGSSVSLMVLSYAKLGALPDKEKGPKLENMILKKPRVFAKELGIKLDPLYKLKKKMVANTVASMHYLIELNKKAGPLLNKKYGKGSAELFEIAVKSNLLMLLYTGGTKDKMSSGIADMIKKNAKIAKLPSSTYSKLVSLIKSQAPRKEMIDALIAMHKDIKKFLKK